MNEHLSPLAQAAQAHIDTIHGGKDTALACCFLAGADTAKAQLDTLEQERNQAIEAMKCEGLLPIAAPCQKCQKLWPHPGVLSSNPVCEPCRRADRDTLQERLQTADALIRATPCGIEGPNVLMQDCGLPQCGRCDYLGHD